MSDQRPNILVIITDQQVADSIAAAGHPHLRTPALDSIVTGGLRCERAYCTYPLCTPSRASLFTGRHPAELGISGNVKSLPEEGREQELGHLLRAAGYDCAYAGKWHLPKQGMDGDHGFEVLCGMDDPLATERSVAFLAREHERPFLLVTSYFQPHGCCPFHRYPDPRACPQLGLDHYAAFSAYGRDWGYDWPEDADQVSFTERCPPLPDNFAIGAGEAGIVEGVRNNDREIPADKRPPFWRPQEVFNAAKDWGDDSFRHYRWAYDRLVEWVDAQIGQLLAALDARGLSDNTLVVFTSDHGDMIGAHHMVAKNVFFEEATRIPLALRLPGRIPAGGVIDDRLVSNGLDLLPTLCDYAGATTPEDLAGLSLRPLLEGQTVDDWRDHLVFQNGPGDGRCVHDGRHVYSCYQEGEPAEELYDLTDDPGQLHNRIDDPRYAEVVARQRERLARWRARYEHV